MEPIDAFWHVVHLVLPGVLTGMVAAGISKLLWRSELRQVPWLHLTAWASSAGVLSLIGGLMVFGQDGRMATYALLVLSTAIALAWAGWGRRSSHHTPKRPSAGRR
jgi:hypothetical protein